MAKAADQRAFPNQFGGGMTLHQWFASQYKPTPEQATAADRLGDHAIAMLAAWAFEYATALCSLYDQEAEENK